MLIYRRGTTGTMLFSNKMYVITAFVISGITTVFRYLPPTRKMTINTFISFSFFASTANPQGLNFRDLAKIYEDQPEDGSFCGKSLLLNSCLLLTGSKRGLANSFTLNIAKNCGFNQTPCSI